MKITLTFDNGPDPVTTPYVLKELHDAQVPAIFFHVGTKLQQPEAAALIQQISSAGHLIGNHSFTHTVPLGKCDATTAVEEIDHTQNLLATLGVNATMFRPFGGGGNLNRELLHPAALRYIQAHKMSCVTWNCVPRDWVDPLHWRERALLDIEQRDWSVVVLHDLENRGMEYLRQFIDEARAKGAVFTNELPVDCLPVLDGELQWDVSHLMPETDLNSAL